MGAGAGEVSTHPVSLTCVHITWGTATDLRQCVSSEVLALLDAMRGLLKREFKLNFAAWSQPGNVSAKCDGFNGKRLRLVPVALHPPGLSVMRVNTAWGQHEQQGGGPGKASASLCYSEVRAWVWVWIHAIIWGAMRSCQSHSQRGSSPCVRANIQGNTWRSISNVLLPSTDLPGLVRQVAKTHRRWLLVKH